MNKKLQEMWDSAHEMPLGAYVPEGTLLVRRDPVSLSHYEAASSGYWNPISDTAPVRSVDPLPDSEDTGAIIVHSNSENTVHLDTYGGECYYLTESQALNLVRKITEAIDGH